MAAAVLVALLMAILTLCFPVSAAQGVRNGLLLAADAALPALFPFCVAAGLFADTGAADALGRPFSSFLRRQFHLPSTAAAPLLLGLCGGYPIGAQTAANLVRTGQLSAADAEQTILFCSCASPAFCIGLCGVRLCGSAGIGAMLYALQVAGALVCGRLLRPRALAPSRTCTAAPAAPYKSLAAMLSHAVQHSAQTMLLITAYLVFFSVWIALLEPLLRLVGRAAAPLSALLELTCGLRSFAGAGAVPPLPLLSFLLAFGGLSAHFQMRAVLQPQGIPVHRLLPAKLLHGVLAAALTLPLQPLFTAIRPVFSPLQKDLSLSDPSVIFIFSLLFLRFLLEKGGEIRYNDLK